MGVTIYDVAKKAKVGIGTVSRVLNNSPHIAPKTKEKVLKVIKELKYQPHAMAQSLARRRSNTIACIVPDFTSYFFVELLQGIQQEISQQDYDLILYCVDELEKKDIFLRRTLREKKVDGVLLISLTIENRQVERFLQTGFPIALVDSYHPKLDSFTIENENGAYLATRHLLELGHNKVAMITGDIDSAPVQNRIAGYKRALDKFNVTYNDQLVITTDNTDDPELMLNHGFNKKAGYVGMQKLLQLDTRPTSVFASSDVQAIGALRAVSEKGLRIPEDIAIVGYDDIELAEWVDLTTMRQPKFEIGSIAVNHLIRKINNRDIELMQKSFLPELIIRRSSGNSLKSN